MCANNIIREFDLCRWPPPLYLIEQAKVHLSEHTNNYILAEYVRLSEYATRLSNTVYEALEIIEVAERNMSSETYMRLIDSMHSLALVGERKSDLYFEMFDLAQITMDRIYKS